MKKTVYDDKNKVEYEFTEADIRDALISHFKISVGGKNCQLYMEIFEGFLSKPATCDMVIVNEPLNT